MRLEVQRSLWAPPLRQETEGLPGALPEGQQQEKVLPLRLFQDSLLLWEHVLKRSQPWEPWELILEGLLAGQPLQEVAKPLGLLQEGVKPQVGQLPPVGLADLGGPENMATPQSW